jgi:hypothetical protein
MLYRWDDPLAVCAKSQQKQPPLCRNLSLVTRHMKMFVLRKQMRSARLYVLQWLMMQIWLQAYFVLKVIVYFDNRKETTTRNFIVPGKILHVSITTIETSM